MAFVLIIMIYGGCVVILYAYPALLTAMQCFFAPVEAPQLYVQCYDGEDEEDDLATALIAQEWAGAPQRTVVLYNARLAVQYAGANHIVVNASN